MAVSSPHPRAQPEDKALLTAIISKATCYN